jgi:hypothetical protein
MGKVDLVAISTLSCGPYSPVRQGPMNLAAIHRQRVDDPITSYNRRNCIQPRQALRGLEGFSTRFMMQHLPPG